jgi:tRNA (uracil-5-)-methyltransferase TRM9
MDRKTVNKLNQLNNEFYLKTQEYFNTTRQFNWAGWDKLLPYLPVGKAGLQGWTLKVLDVGCGNGRFGEFLIKKGFKIDYTGIDSNQYLLDLAKSKLPKAKLIKQDILKPVKLKADFDLVVLFGVIHHVPGSETRLQLIKELVKLLQKNGLLVFTNWHFNKFKRFNSYVIPWKKVGLIKSQIETGDYLLDWKKGVTAYRYCNLMTEKELKQIQTELKMKLVADYLADAKSGQGNRYVILSKNR